MAANKLCINTPKSSALLIPPKSDAQINYQSIIFDGALINTDKFAKHLGIQIDSDLTFKSNIANLHSKLSRSLGIMFKVKRFFRKNILLQLCYTMFNSHLLYCMTVWTSTFSTYLNLIRMFQNKAVRLIAGFDDKHPTSSIYKSYNILKLDDMV